MMSLMQDNVNELWNGKYSEKREPLDTEIPVGQAYTAIQTFLKGACELQKQSGIMQMLGEDDIVMLQSLESNYSKDTDSETEQTYEAAPWQYGAAVALDDSFDNTISDYFVTSDISKELSAWIFIISLKIRECWLLLMRCLEYRFILHIIVQMWIVLRHRLQ